MVQFLSMALIKVEACSDINVCCAKSNSATESSVSITFARMDGSGKSRPRISGGINYHTINEAAGREPTRTYRGYVMDINSLGHGLDERC
jgi:hypothetical protein